MKYMFREVNLKKGLADMAGITTAFVDVAQSWDPKIIFGFVTSGYYVEIICKPILLWNSFYYSGKGKLKEL